MKKVNAKESLEEFARGLKACRSFLLASHVNPEGDSVGSLLALQSLLRRLGKKTQIVCESPFPSRFDFLKQDHWSQTADIKPVRKFDAIVTTDCPLLDRIGSVTRLLQPDTVIFNIDHHHTNTRFGHYNYINPEASACGEVVYDLFKYFRKAVNGPEAEALYVSISTDTGSFEYSNTSEKAHLIAGELAKKIDIEKINERLYSIYSLQTLKLYQLLIGKIRFSKNRGIAWARVTQNDIKKTGSTYADTEGFIDFLKNLKEARFAFFLTEEKTGDVRVSLRSKGKDDISQVAAYFGGGGHMKAAGCVIRGSMDQAEKLILERIRYEFGSPAKYL